MLHSCPRRVLSHSIHAGHHSCLYSVTTLHHLVQTCPGMDTAVGTVYGPCRLSLQVSRHNHSIVSANLGSACRLVLYLVVAAGLC